VHGSNRFESAKLYFRGAKMKMKRLLTILLALSFAVSMVACSSGNSSGGSGKKVEVIWWNAANEQQTILQKIADEFNKTHNDIHVTVQLNAGADYYTKLQTVLAANNGPDIMWMNGTYFPKFQSKGFLMSYSDYIKKDNFDMGNYPKTLVDLYSVDGKVYGMPKDFDTIGLFYNKALFDKANVKYPDDTWTWDTLRDAAKKLTVTQDGKTSQWGIAATNSLQESVYPLMAQNGSKLISKDRKSTTVGSDEAIGAVQYLYDLMYTDKTSPDGKYMTENDPMQLFQSEKVAMIMTGSWMAKPFYDALKDKVDAATLPHQAQKGNVIHGIGWVTNAKTKHPDQVWEVIKWLGSEQVAKIQADTGTVIPAFNGTQNAWIKSMPMNLKVFMDMTQYALPYPTANDAEWETPVTTHITNIWLNKEKPAAGMKAAQTEANAILSK
jgi:multiple sugar transport system substrate-binding protein